MQLLSVSKVVQDKKDNEVKRLAYIKSLEKKELDLLARLNHLKKFVKEEEDLIGNAFESFKKDLEIKKITLSLELESLEDLKKEAMKPVDEKMDKATQLLSQVEEEKAIIDKKITDLEAQKEATITERQKMMEAINQYQDKLDDLDEREDEMTIRNERLKNSEESISVSSKNIIAKWKEYHKAVNDFNQNIKIREEEVKNQTIVNDSVRNELENEKNRLNQLDREIKDKYIALEQAKKHLGI